MIFKIELFGPTYKMGYIRDIGMLVSIISHLNDTIKPAYSMHIICMGNNQNGLVDPDFIDNIEW